MGEDQSNLSAKRSTCGLRYSMSGVATAKSHPICVNVLRLIMRRFSCLSVSIGYDTVCPQGRALGYLFYHILIPSTILPETALLRTAGAEKRIYTMIYCINICWYFSVSGPRAHLTGSVTCIFGCSEGQANTYYMAVVFIICFEDKRFIIIAIFCKKLVKCSNPTGFFLSPFELPDAPAGRRVHLYVWPAIVELTEHYVGVYNLRPQSFKKPTMKGTKTRRVSHKGHYEPRRTLRFFIKGACAARSAPLTL